MKKALLFLTLLPFSFTSTYAQIELLNDGSFESSPWYYYWSFDATTDLWGGTGSCGAYDGNNYMWHGDQYEDYGVNYGYAEMHQTVSIPSNATTCTLSFRVSANTTESGSSLYDYLEVSIKNTSGTMLYSFGSISNLDANYGLPGCQSWVYYYVSVPATYFGQTVNIAFDWSTDGSYPTIFRLDDVSLSYDSSNPCTYTLSTYNYTLPANDGGTYTNVSMVNTQAGCFWDAYVVNGGSWLATSSSGVGSGGVAITVSENTSSAPRSGTIDVNGELLTITQPGNCEYSLSQYTFQCPDHEASSYTNIALVNTFSGCEWDAVVLSGNEWMNTSSSGTGNGAVSINVLENNTAFDRSGEITIGQMTLTVVQPANPWLTGVEELAQSFHIYPNPVDELLTVSIPGKQLGSGYTIMDQSGRVVMSGTLTDITSAINVSGLAQGVYLLQLGDTHVQKLVRK